MQIRGSTKIQTLNEDEIEKMRVVCRIGREVLEEGAKAVAIGVTTDEIDRIVHEACIGLLFSLYLIVNTNLLTDCGQSLAHTI